MSLRVVREIPERDWRRFVDNHPDGNIYHTPEMFEVFRRAQRHQPQVWATVDEGGAILALFTPVELTVKSGPMRYLTTRSVVYGSILSLPTEEGKQALSMLLRAYRRYAVRRPALFTELRHVSDASAYREVLEANRFEHEEHLNYLVDLQRPLDEIWNGVVKPARKAVERGQKRGLVVEEATDPACVAEVYRILTQTFSRAQVPLADISLFQAAFDVLVPKGMARFVLAQADGKYAGTQVELHYKGVITCWYIGFDKELHAYYPNDALVWHSLAWGAAHACRCYDFGGAGRPDIPYGPREFKAKFGGQLVNYGRATQVHRPMVLALSRAGYQVYRKTL